MANPQMLETSDARNAAVVAADVLIAVPSPTQGLLLQERVNAAATSLGAGQLRFAVAYPGTEGAGLLAHRSEAGRDEGRGQRWNDDTEAAQDSHDDRHTEATLPMIEYSLTQQAAPAPWLGLSTAYARIAELAVKVGAKTCAILSADLAAFDAMSIRTLIEPVQDGRAELAMPIYALSKFEGLLNSGILYPFSRALYGRRVRYPLGPDFATTPSLLARMGPRKTRAGESEDELAAVWPVTEAVLADAAVAQVHLDGRHGAQNEGLDLSTVLGHLAGSLFSDAEKNPVVWQRIRGSQAGLVLGTAGASGESDRVDVRPMIEGFHLASRNLQEVWSLVLPPVTLLEIKRLGRATPEQFRIADALWARIIYDFALAYRLRTLSRNHLLGALTPLYLGWVASYAQEIAEMDAAGAEQRVEKLAKSYEDEKAYLVSRWRWPDRFNP